MTWNCGHRCVTFFLRACLSLLRLDLFFVWFSPILAYLFSSESALQSLSTPLLMFSYCIILPLKTDLPFLSSVRFLKAICTVAFVFLSIQLKFIPSSPQTIMQNVIVKDYQPFCVSHIYGDLFKLDCRTFLFSKSEIFKWPHQMVCVALFSFLSLETFQWCNS